MLLSFFPLFLSYFVPLISLLPPLCRPWQVRQVHDRKADKDHPPERLHAQRAAGLLQHRIQGSNRERISYHPCRAQRSMPIPSWPQSHAHRSYHRLQSRALSQEPVTSAVQLDSPQTNCLRLARSATCRQTPSTSHPTTPLSFPRLTPSYPEVTDFGHFTLFPQVKISVLQGEFHSIRFLQTRIR